ncbi:hypothetical protein Nepgr_005870 [Nepenthes gracilis]|uniref:Remorin C-terminal domain-containing protein n=1 Tax=Nepenthes gracilis TaxID=150966 RepID=A0AAD3S450_NEPGR|nr:hypothetical protein Nepgr_005870 [Nepenthes gracilis]
MAELRFRASNTMAVRARGFRGPDVSPDSVILTQESNFSVFSSASASADRCSFASDALDHESLVTEISQRHLAGNEEKGRGSLSGPDQNRPDLSKSAAITINNCNLSRKVDKARDFRSISTVQREEDNKLFDVDDEIQCLDSARTSFSLALKECQERRSRSEAITKTLERRRPASLDLNYPGAANLVASSPRIGGMKKGAVSSRKSGNFPSPGTPNYRHGSGGSNKGWSSERVPLPTNGNRRQVGASLMPFNNGRTLPSKWEDAERWIFSPVAGDGVIRPSYQQLHRRPKSKSGPLGPLGTGYYSLYSPAVPVYEYERSNVNNLIVASPFSAAVIAAEGLSIHGGGDGAAFTNRTEPCIARSASVHGCTDLICQSSLTTLQDEKVDDLKDDATISQPVSRRDMATQMSPTGSSNSSPRRSLFSPSTPSILPVVEVQDFSSSKAEVRDVQVDERVTVTRWSKKHKSQIPSKASEDVTDWKMMAVEACSSAWEVSETARNISKANREEAKIIAWENLHKAKAEAAIRKLEMKLEKKRSSSMDKIMNKLRSAQKKAQEMRSMHKEAHHMSKALYKAISFRKTGQMGSLSGCFTCHGFNIHQAEI